MGTSVYTRGGILEAAKSHQGRCLPGDPKCSQAEKRVNIVCDTNVLISGVLFGGHAREILQLASRGVLINFISPDILREAERVLGRSKFGLRPEHVIEIMALFKDTFEIVIPSLEV